MTTLRAFLKRSNRAEAGIGRLFAGIFCAAALLFAGAPAAEAHAFEKPFSHYANGQSLKAVLTSFAKAQGLKPEFDDELKGRVSGRFTKVDAEAFLAAMNEAYGAGWYVLGGSIHFYNVESAGKDFLTVPSGSAESLVESLKRSGLLAEELPVKINNDANMITFTGPAGYLEQVRTAAAAYLAVQTEKIVMKVFPVKHAWADDITIENMDQTITVPGVASILRGMVMGQSVGGTTVSQRRNTAKSVESLGAPGLSRQAEKKNQASPAAPMTPVLQGNISIMADPRVNAVLGF